MAKDVELRGWTAMIYVADSRDVAGAVRRSQRLHWTPKDGQAEAESWASELGHEIVWQSVDDLTLIGRMPGHFIVEPVSYYQKVFAERPRQRKDLKLSARHRPDRAGPDARRGAGSPSPTPCCPRRSRRRYRQMGCRKPVALASLSG